MILICSAWNEETRYLKLNPSKFQILHLGIGYLEAGINLTQFLNKNSEEAPEKIIFIGTAGLVSNMELDWSNPIYSVSEISLNLTASLKNEAYIPAPYPLFRAQGIKELPKSHCISSLEITQSRELSKLILENYKNITIQDGNTLEETPLLESMELYGVASVAEKFKIPYSAILAVSNKTDENAHLEWEKNHRKTSELACKALSRISDASL